MGFSGQSVTKCQNRFSVPPRTYPSGVCIDRGAQVAYITHMKANQGGREDGRVMEYNTHSFHIGITYIVFSVNNLVDGEQMGRIHRIISHLIIYHPDNYLRIFKYVFPIMCTQ